MLWGDGSTTPPIDTPKCGFEGELCIESYGENTMDILFVTINEKSGVTTRYLVVKDNCGICNLSLLILTVSTSALMYH